MSAVEQTELKAADVISAPHADASSRKITVIEPERGLVGLSLSEIWAYRDLLVTLAERDVKLRYRQTAIGVAWVLFQPLLAALIMALLFGVLGKGRFGSDGLPYFLFAFAGQVGWNAFGNTVTKANTSLIQNANMVSKIYFPRLVLPLSTVLSTLIDFGLGIIVLALLMVVYRTPPSFAVFLAPIFLAFLLIMAIGIGLFTSALSVSYRDVQYVVPVFLQLLMYASPVSYAVPADVPHYVRVFYFANPITSLIQGMRWSLLGTHNPPEVTGVIYSAIFAMCVFVFGMVSFRNMERRFADVI